MQDYKNEFYTYEKEGERMAEIFNSLFEKIRNGINEAKLQLEDNKRRFEENKRQFEETKGQFEETKRQFEETKKNIIEIRDEIETEKEDNRRNERWKILKEFLKFNHKIKKEEQEGFNKILEERIFCN